MKKVLLSLVLAVMSMAAFAQGGISGILIDDTNLPLIGATVSAIDGSGAVLGTITDLDGSYELLLKDGTYKVTLAYTGYGTLNQDVTISGSMMDLGTSTLEFSSIGLDQITVVADVAIDRKTPVAVSTITSETIQAKMGNQEFVEIMKMTPSITTSKDAGGFGDSRINVRGFPQEDVALLLNGIPVNGMEDNKIYWSNWAGLGDVTRTIQVQRGLGASKLAVASVGGTINIITNGTDQEKGGNVFTSIGNNGYVKTGLTLSTGRTDDGWAFTFSGSRTTGDGYIENTYIDAWTYFGSITKEIGENQLLMLTGVGAPQRHGQRDFPHNIGDLRNTYGIRWNDDAGTYQGKQTSIRENFYHKPQIGLNHIWDISDKSNLTTSAYLSVGRGGGTGDIGGLVRGDGAYRGREFRQSRDSYGHFQFDQVALYNQGMANALYDTSMMAVYFEDDNGESGTAQIAANGKNGLIKRASMNLHKWYGLLSTFNTELSPNLTLSTGIDLRWYTGSHFRKTVNLWGADYWFDDDNVNETADWVDFNGDGVKDSDEMGLLVRPKNDAARRLFGDVPNDEKIDYYNDEDINWYGAFAELEYSSGSLSAFLSGALNNTSMRRYDFFNKTPGNQVTDWLNFIGGNVKGGLNYNLNENHNVFFNAGLISRAPYFDALFPTFDNDAANKDAVNEQVISFEVGYGYRGRGLRANLNGYYTSWSNKTTVNTFRGDDDQTYILNLLGVDAVHSGVEFDFASRLASWLDLGGFISVGNWEWANDPTGTISDDNQNVVGETKLYLDGLKVANGAQTTLGLAADFYLNKDLVVDIMYKYRDNLYSNFEPGDRDDEALAGVQALLLPSYGLTDAGLTWRFKFMEQNASMRANINNLFDERFVQFAFDNVGSEDGNINDDRDSQKYKDKLDSTRGWFGFGRTWNVTFKMDF